MRKQEELDARSGKLMTGVLLGSLALSAASLLGFGLLAEEVLRGATQNFDLMVRSAVHNASSPGLTMAMEIITRFGSPTLIAGELVIALIILLAQHKRRGALLVTVAIVGASFLDFVLKLSFHRARPEAFFGSEPASFSFPSGHALVSLCFYGTLAALATARLPSRSLAVVVWITAAVLVALIGYSRIYLGVHYPTDVIGGYLAAVIWVTAIAFVDRAIGAHKRLLRSR